MYFNRYLFEKISIDGPLLGGRGQVVSSLVPDNCGMLKVPANGTILYLKRPRQTSAHRYILEHGVAHLPGDDLVAVADDVQRGDLDRVEDALLVELEPPAE